MIEKRDSKLNKLKSAKKHKETIRILKLANAPKPKARLGVKPGIRLKPQIDQEMEEIKKEIHAFRIKAGKDREQMKQLLRKRFLKSKGRSNM